jgi:pyruvate/2-oxoglutarate dehydrogenase complex dihydrolipoamide dehydrogenase (E3) component
MSAAVIEEDRFGGCCLWWACVPTKTLIECGKVYRQTLRGGMLGTRAGGVELDYPQVQPSGGGGCYGMRTTSLRAKMGSV